jgi:hypothetical protein
MLYCSRLKRLDLPAVTVKRPRITKLSAADLRKTIVGAKKEPGSGSQHNRLVIVAALLFDRVRPARQLK